MINFLLRLFGRCTHQRTGFPISPGGAPAYIVCLDCGERRSYNWQTMRVGAAVESEPVAEVEFAESRWAPIVPPRAREKEAEEKVKVIRKRKA